MLQLKLTIMNTKEAFEQFQTDELKKEYEEDLNQVDINDAYSIQKFLDNKGVDTERVTKSQCKLLNLDYEEGYYVSTWRDEYLSK